MTKPRKGLKPIVIFLALFFVSASLFFLLGRSYDNAVFTVLDNAILHYMIAHTNTQMTVFMSIITFFGTIGGVSSIWLLMVLISRFDKKIVISGIAIISEYLVNGIFKNIYMRPRPPVPRLTLAEGFSYISGHSAVSLVMSVILINVFVRNMKRGVLRNILYVFLTVMPFLIAVSRLYLRAHYFTDILGGWFVGLAYLSILAVITLFRNKLSEEDCDGSL